MEDRTIPRQTIAVTLALSDGRVLSGEIMIDLDTRLSDFLNDRDAFIVVTDRDRAIHIVNKAQIVEARVL